MFKNMQEKTRPIIIQNANGSNKENQLRSVQKCYNVFMACYVINAASV